MPERDFTKPLELEFEEEGTPKLKVPADEREIYRRAQFDRMNAKLNEIMAKPASGVDKEAPHTLTQVAKIAKILKQKGEVTLWDTFYLPGNGIDCLRLGARISDLKAMGIEFEETEPGSGRAPMVELPNGKKVAHYKLMWFDPFGVRATREGRA